MDTAGIRDTADIIEEIGVQKAISHAKEADLIIYVIDSSAPLDQNDYDILKNHLSQRFNTPVKLTCDSSGKGKISFSFRDEAELERLIAIFDTAKQ